VLGNGDDLSGWLLDLNLATPGGVDPFSQKNQWFYGSLLSSILAKADQGMYVDMSNCHSLLDLTGH
jgi:lysophospholipase